MTERPILFSAEMVRAILKGDKTQTRRVMKLTSLGHIKAPIMYGRRKPDDRNAPDACPYGAPGDALWVRETWAPHPHGVMRCGAVYCAEPGAVPDAGRWRPSIHMPRWASRITLRITDVRVERLQDISEEDAKAEGATMRPACHGFQYRSPGWSMDWSEVGKFSHFAPGAQRGKKVFLTESDVSLGSAKWAFASFWNTINGRSAWDANTWVWVLSFERVEP